MRKKCVWIILGLAVVLAIGIMWFGKWKSEERLRFAKRLGSGMNLGNSLDATNLRDYDPDAAELDYELFWGNPKITEEQLCAIKEAGFSCVRIPVTWEDHMDAEGNISDVWMERVAEVIDMALEEGLYVILDTHHEEWLNLVLERENEICARYGYAWKQIAERFADYDEHLLFEGMNEPRLRDSEHEWDAGTPKMREMVNRLNAVFVDAVRKAGGKNQSRYLIICPYATNTQTEALEDLEVLDGNIIVAVHMYLPYSFCQDDEGTADWNADDPDSAGQIRRVFSELNRLFIEKKIPVVITEYGCKDKDNQEARMRWVLYYKELADASGIPCIWWDDGSTYQILDRENVEWLHKELVEELVK